MCASTWVPGVSTSQRRRAIKPASATPSANTRPTENQTSDTSVPVRGPSISHCSTCGIASATRLASRDATMAT
jgi:hypothetical protein